MCSIRRTLETQSPISSSPPSNDAGRQREPECLSSIAFRSVQLFNKFVAPFSILVALDARGSLSLVWLFCCQKVLPFSISPHLPLRCIAFLSQAQHCLQLCSAVATGHHHGILYAYSCITTSWLKPPRGRMSKSQRTPPFIINQIICVHPSKTVFCLPIERTHTGRLCSSASFGEDQSHTEQFCLRCKPS